MSCFGRVGTDAHDAGDATMSGWEPGRATAAELLPTVLGDYWFHSRGFIPSATLVRLLGELGVGADAARAALSRLSRDGRLEGIRQGRRTAYRLAPALVDAAAAQGRRLMRFGADPVTWDGHWTCVAFSIPEADAHRRAHLRRRLRALGLGALFDGLWITPHAPLDALDRCLTDLGVTDAAVLRAREVPRPSGVALTDAWGLPSLRAGYDDLAALVDDVAARLRGGAVPPAEALLARTELMRRWRALAMSDPLLPDALLPADWPRRAVRAGFVAAYDTLGPLAEQRVRQLAGEDGTDPDAAPRHHRVADIAEAPLPSPADAGRTDEFRRSGTSSRP
jgi:phenylacetic acid degradation operon negative regulatory protein